MQMDRTEKSHNLFLVVFFLLFTLLLFLYAYIPSFHVAFCYDDNGYILEDVHIRMADFSFAGLKNAALHGLPHHRPLSNITFALNYYFGGYDPFGYHVVNFIIHLLSWLILFRLFYLTLNLVAGFPFNRAKVERNIFLPALLAASLWALHPVNTQAVTYIVQRMTSLAAFFYFLSMLCYVEARISLILSNGYNFKSCSLFVLSIICGACALMAKENAAMLPIMVVLYEWIFFHESDSAWLKEKLPMIIGALLIVSLIGLYYLNFDPMGWLSSQYGRRPFTMPQRVMTEWRVVVYYLSLVFLPFPWRLNLDHDYPLSYSLFHPPTTILSAAALILLFCWAVYMLRRDRLASFAIFWFLGNLAIESSFIGIEIIYEHRIYLPCAFLIFASVVWVGKSIPSRRIALVAGICLLLLFAAGTHSRNSLWADPVAFWRDVAAKAPRKMRPQNDLGVALYDAGRLDEAIIAYKKAIDLDPGNAEAWNNLGNALSDLGRMTEAIRSYRKAISLSPRYVKPMANLGDALIKEKRYDEAIEVLDRAISLDPKCFHAFLNLGSAWLRKGNIAVAESALKKAIELNPGSAQAYNNLGIVEIAKGNFREAERCFRLALEINPDHTSARKNLLLLRQRLQQQNGIAGSR